MAERSLCRLPTDATGWHKSARYVGGDSVRDCESVQRPERQQTQLELDTLRNRKPVKTVQQDMLDVVMLFGADQ